MSELPKKKSKLTKAQEVKLIKAAKPLFEYWVITSEQIRRFSEAAMEAASVYRIASEKVMGMAKVMLQAQERVASQLSHLAQILVQFKQISFIIPVPKFYSEVKEPLPIYIQPDKPYVAKILPTPNRKQKFSLENVSIKEQGFMLNDQYISGMTIKSLPGKLFELMLRKDLAGTIPDNLLKNVLGIKKDDYPALLTVINDLKNILKNNHLELDMVRNRAIKQYKVNAITKRIRNPKKRRKTKSSAKVS